MKKNSKNALTLRSPLCPEECRRRLRDSLNTSIFSMFGDKPLSGKVSGNRIKIRKTIRYNNSFQTILTAEMEPDGAGTLLKGRFGMHPFVKIFLIIWFGGVLLMGGAEWIIVLMQSVDAGPSSGGSLLRQLSGLPLMLAVGFGLWRLGRYFAKNEADYLRGFLLDLLEATEAES